MVLWCVRLGYFEREPPVEIGRRRGDLDVFADRTAIAPNGTVEKGKKGERQSNRRVKMKEGERNVIRTSRRCC